MQVSGTWQQLLVGKAECRLLDGGMQGWEVDIGRVGYCGLMDRRRCELCRQLRVWSAVVGPLSAQSLLRLQCHRLIVASSATSYSTVSLLPPLHTTHRLLLCM